MLVYYARSATVLLVGVLLLSLIQCAMLKSAHEHAVGLARDLDAARMAAAGGIVAQPGSPVQVERAITERVRSQIANVRAHVPNARPVAVIQATTGPITAPPVKVEPGKQTDDCIAHWSETPSVECEIAEVRAASGAASVVGEARLMVGDGVRLSAPFDAKTSRWIVTDADLPKPNTRPKWALSGGYGLAAHGRVWDAAVERRVLGPVWAGVAVGSLGGDSFVMVRGRVEF